MRFVTRWTVVVVLTLHGAFHLLGVAQGYGWAEVDSLTEPIGAAAAALWLAAALLMLLAGMVIALRRRWWWAVVGVAALVSQLAILTSWQDARMGTVVNLVLVLLAVLGFASNGPRAYASRWQRQARAALGEVPPRSEVVTEADLAALPEPVARYVRRTGAVGRPKVTSFLAHIHGRIRSGHDQPWMSFAGRQLNTYGPTPRRLFYIEATRAGLPVAVLHVFDDDGATMRAKVLSLVPVLDAHGPEMDQSETVTVFNDLVVMAPAALVDAPVQWNEVSGNRVRATYTRADQSITADLLFDDDGDLVDFSTPDRYRASADGTAFQLQRWNTPITRYRDDGSRRLPAEARAQWDSLAPEGRFTYLEVVLDSLTYNVSPAQVAGAGTASATSSADPVHSPR